MLEWRVVVLVQAVQCLLRSFASHFDTIPHSCSSESRLTVCGTCSNRNFLMANSKSRKTQQPKSTGKKGKKFVEAKVFFCKPLRPQGDQALIR
jgi:hypothetical protein